MNRVSWAAGRHTLQVRQAAAGDHRDHTTDADEVGRLGGLVPPFKCIQSLFNGGEPVSYLFHTMVDWRRLRHRE
jgi:hypothetical protein